MTRHTLRKAAILIASLDARSADALLDEMAPEEAARVRNAVLELWEVDPREQQQVMRDFVGHQAHRDLSGAGAVELDPALAEKLRAQAYRAGSLAPSAPADDRGTPFGFLDHTEATDLAHMLEREHPQTTAIVVAHLPPGRAADVLRRLPPSLQSQALSRIARLTALPGDVVRDIEHELHSLLQHRRQLEPVAPHGLATIQAILQAASLAERQDLLDELARQDPALAGHFGGAFPTAPRPAFTNTAATAETHAPTDKRTFAERHRAAEEERADGPQRIVTFADLERLEDAALAQVLHESSPSTALLALAGASHDFVARILRQLPAREAAQLERKMQQLGPIRLDDVERAQLRLAEVAQRLLEEGRIVLPRAERFAVAA